jgi:hypothetical protein
LPRSEQPILANMRKEGPQERRLNRALAEDCDYYGRELQVFLSDLDDFAVPRFRTDDLEGAWTAGSETIARSTRIMDRYRERFENDIVGLVEVLMGRGIHDPELERRYQHPTNPLGIQSVAQRLSAVSRRLRER